MSQSHNTRELGEIGEPLGAEVDEPLVGPVINELAEPIVKVEDQMVTPVMDMEEDLAILFGVKDDSSDDDFEGPDGDEEVWEVDEECLMEPVTSPSMLVMPPPSTYEAGEYGHGLLVKKVITVSNVEVANSIAIREIGARVSTVEAQMQVMASQMVQVIQQLQTLVAEISSREGTLKQCILGLDRRLADVERRPPGPQ
ncbi:hypothetical protein Tco_0170048 [Tanacetum coccineum]